MISFGRGVIAREHVTPYEEDLQLILSRFYVSFLLLRCIFEFLILFLIARAIDDVELLYRSNVNVSKVDQSASTVPDRDVFRLIDSGGCGVLGRYVYREYGLVRGSK